MGKLKRAGDVSALADMAEAQLRYAIADNSDHTPVSAHERRAAVAQAYESGLSQYTIASIMGVSQARVWQILQRANGKSYRKAKP